jgi:drug/metabolite transporter (DMT)-like permease
MPDTIHDARQTLPSGLDTKRQNVPLGASWIVGASACSASVGLLVQLASHHASSIMIIFTCYAVGCVIVTPIALRKGLGFLATPHLKLQVARAMAGFIYFGSLFIAFRTIPLVDGILLRSTAPIWVPLLLWMFWKQQIQKSIWGPIALGFVGVALVLQPGFGSWAIGYPIALGSGIAYALNNIAARHIN